MNLTRVGLVAVLTVAAIGIVGTWTAWLGGFPAWRLVAAILVIGLAWELLSTRRDRVAAEVLDAEHLYLGRHGHVRLRIRNDARRRLALWLVPVLPGGFDGAAPQHRFEVAAGVAAELPLALRPLRLGEHAWPRVPVRLAGPLGLAWWSRRLEVAAVTRVAPDTLGPRAARVGTSRGGGSQLLRGGSGHELYQLRDYRAGDPRNSIDWKATARARRLVTRIMSEDQHLEIAVLLDAGRTSRTEIDGLSQLGHYANLAARFAEYCVASDDRIGLIAFAGRSLVRLAPARGTAAVVGIREALTPLAPIAEESDVLAAAVELGALVRHRCLVIVLTDLYERSATSRLALAARLLAARHLPLVVGLVSDDVTALARRPARSEADPITSFAAREYLRDVDANVARLARLGAHAFAARPRELDARVIGEYARLRAQRRI